MSIFYGRIAAEILEVLEAKHSKIVVEAGHHRQNRKCHLNAVHDAVVNGDKGLILAVAVDRQTRNPFVHFINCDSKLNKCVDNTLGYWSKKYEYYFIREILAADFDAIESIFSNYRRQLRSELTLFSRLFYKPEMF